MADGRAGEGTVGRRIVLATFGSLGDLHPFVALAKGLQARGHEPWLASSELHRGRVERQGIPFRAIRPAMTDLEHDPEVFRRAMDTRGGPEYVIRELFMPHVRDGFEDLKALAEQADLLVSHSIVYAAPLVAEATGIPWATVGIAPMVFLSRHDPPVFPPAPALRHLRFLGPRFWGFLFSGVRRLVRPWGEPVRRARRELGLPPGGEPLFEGGFSPELVLAIFSKALGAPQPDWPGNTVQTGFLSFDGGGAGLDDDLARFLDAGAPPIVFTLGSSAVMTAGSFYRESLEAARRLGRRAVLLIGNDPRNRPEGPLPEGVIAREYAPYSELFPRAAAVVHQGGVGTTAQGLRAGVPTLIVPWSHDQPDNAYRTVRLGTGLTLARARYNARTASATLRRLLGDPAFAARAAEVGRELRAEDGVGAACDALEALLARRASAVAAGA